jgi:hypothetical protein
LSKTDPDAYLNGRTSVSLDKGAAIFFKTFKVQSKPISSIDFKLEVTVKQLFFGGLVLCMTIISKLKALQSETEWDIKCEGLH